MDFKELIAGDAEKALEAIKEGGVVNDDAIKEWNNERVIRDEQVGNRKDKNIKDETFAVNKIPIPFQKQIVRTASAFLFGNPVRMISEEDIKEITDKWEDLRLDSMVLKACGWAKAFMHSALVFRIVKDDVLGKLEIKVNVIDPRTTKMYAHYDDFDSMDGFVLEKNVKNEDGDEVTKYFLYDKENIRIWQDDGDGITEIQNSKHLFDRIPVSYIREEEVEYEEVKELIDRYEMANSRHGDTNDYFGAPIFKATGDVDEPIKKDDTGSFYLLDILETQKGDMVKSDLDVLSWDNSPESVKYEMDRLERLIYKLSNTPDLSLENLKGIGPVSGVALKLMFLAPIMKAKFAEAIYRTFIERAINVMRSGMVGSKEAQNSIYEKRVSVEFTSVLPEHLTEIMEMLTTATGGKAVMSQETALKYNPMILDEAGEIKKIKAESSTEAGTLNIL